MDWAKLIHHTVFGGLAAMGFGVLFNIGYRALLWCGVSGGLALAVRTAGLQLGWSLEGASFAAALAVGSVVQVFQERIGVSRNTLDVAGCIPMVPGGFAAKAILGLFALTAPAPKAADATLILAVENFLRVLFTIGAIGTGVAIPAMLLRVRRPPR
ncbi:MAG TPA: threonine/serine exporter family protein [Bacillota bacterium]|nr:threonine/serine exporter family protein [Bacillota bacterium]